MATRQGDGTLITLEDVGRFAGGSAQVAWALCDEFGIAVERNWAGEPAITPEDARRLVTGYAARQAEIRRKAEAHRRWAERREREHREKIAREREEQRQAQEAALAAAAETHREEMRRKFAEQERRRVEERRLYEPDTSIEAFERDGGR